MENKISDFERTVGMTLPEAKQYLIDAGQWERTKDYDGYTIVETARRMRDKNKA